MSEGNHTPGPWESWWSSITSAEGHIETGRIESEQGAVICHLVMSNEVDANARLIKAAPELLKALTVLCERVAHYAPAMERNGDLVEALAAIARAEGRS